MNSFKNMIKSLYVNINCTNQQRPRYAPRKKNLKNVNNHWTLEEKKPFVKEYKVLFTRTAIK